MSSHNEDAKKPEKGSTLKYTKMSRRLSAWESLYIGPITKGLLYTFTHFWKNTLTRRQVVTIEYPDVKKPLSGRWRGRHWLTTRSNGMATCVACKMCEMACPSNCITIEAGELETPYLTDRQRIDKYPITFEIDLARCIYCGLCVEACPEDAIRMDSGIAGRVGYTREETVINKDDLLNPPEPPHEVIYMEKAYPQPARLPKILRRYRGRKTSE